MSWWKEELVVSEFLCNVFSGLFLHFPLKSFLETLVVSRHHCSESVLSFICLGFRSSWFYKLVAVTSLTLHLMASLSTDCFPVRLPLCHLSSVFLIILQNYQVYSLQTSFFFFFLKQHYFDNDKPILECDRKMIPSVDVLHCFVISH